MAKPKFYVVWNGVNDGVYTSWEACKEAVIGFPGAKYKSFKTEAEAEEAFALGYEAYQTKQKEADMSSSASVSSHSSSTSTSVSTSCTSASTSCTSTATSCTSTSASCVNPASSLGSPCDIKGNGQDTNGNAQVSDGSTMNTQQSTTLPAGAINNSIAVDAACSKNPGPMEYRGVYLRTGKEIFHFGPVYGTNNIGEFLAIVHGLALLKQNNLHDMPIYSDSRNAQLWVRQKKCKTTLERNEKTEKLFQLIERAENWLKTNTYRNPIIKWPTEQWGEIPADFGRK